MNHERYSDKTADLAVGRSNRNKSSLSAKAIYARFSELPVAEKYTITKYKGTGFNNAIVLTTDTNSQLLFTITRKGWMLEAM